MPIQTRSVSGAQPTRLPTRW